MPFLSFSILHIYIYIYMFFFYVLYPLPHFDIDRQSYYRLFRCNERQNKQKKNTLFLSFLSSTDRIRKTIFLFLLGKRISSVDRHVYLLFSPQTKTNHHHHPFGFLFIEQTKNQFSLSSF